MEGGREREQLPQLLALKVMRLTKPTLMPYQPVVCESRDLCGDVFLKMNSNDLAKPRNLDYFPLGDMLTLPQNFGNIFLGETFSSYISVHNDSSQTCREIVLKADLQTSSQRLALSSINSQPIQELLSNHSIDDVIHHEVKELGTHILVCAVSYTTNSGERMQFRKFFKFQVLKPLDVKTKFYNAEHFISDDVYLEAQIQNITPGPIYMEQVSLDPSPQYTSKQLNSMEGDGEDQVFGKPNYLNAMDTRQYLYCLTPNSELYGENKVLKGVTNIGKLDIVWKTNMGEKGRLQTSQLQRVAPGYGDIRLTVESVPDTVSLETTFNLTCRITNCCERTMDLTLVLQNLPGIGLMWCGISGKQLGKLPQNESMDIPLTLLAITPGLQTLSGLRLTDNFLKRTYEHDDITQVLVLDGDIH
ncbi:trafficking protein particle complex subunit 13-like isoform X1 [Gigantopelta aegis]|uniref:trafficking protein particle complex subunit 13-like isoform X1 n=1 Tax=Gigantopelta aegis TaxID=1735272 RepID=UPI001B8893E1|nr:trafficking protein particle complex subunit 13-like isoform X1 [Gigantopelta aegis]